MRLSPMLAAAVANAVLLLPCLVYAQPSQTLSLPPLLVTARLAFGQAADRAVGEIVGTWRGTSVCVDRQAAPACNDEQVVYEIGASPGKADSVTVKADKIVDGKRVPMGAMDFTREATTGTWTAEVETPRFHSLWRLTVDGARMTGIATLIPSGAVVRRVDLRKVP